MYGMSYVSVYGMSHFEGDHIRLIPMPAACNCIRAGTTMQRPAAEKNFLHAARGCIECMCTQRQAEAGSRGAVPAEKARCTCTDVAPSLAAACELSHLGCPRCKYRAC